MAAGAYSGGSRSDDVSAECFLSLEGTVPEGKFQTGGSLADF